MIWDVKMQSPRNELTVRIEAPEITLAIGDALAIWEVDKDETDPMSLAIHQVVA